MPTDPSPSGRRFSAEELAQQLDARADTVFTLMQHAAAIIREQDAALAGIRTWLEARHGWFQDPADALAELDRLEGR